MIFVFDFLVEIITRILIHFECKIMLDSKPGMNSEIRK